MNDWGAQTWGEPCRECGFSWDTPADQALATMTTVPARFRAVTDDATGTETGAGLTWSVGAYVCHVADNLRVFAERLVGVTRSGNPQVAAYDQDELAAARHYADIPLRRCAVVARAGGRRLAQRRGDGPQRPARPSTTPSVATTSGATS